MNILGVRIYNKHVFTRFSQNPDERESLVSLHVRIYMEGAVEVAKRIANKDFQGAAAAISESIRNNQVGPGTGEAELAKLQDIADKLESWAGVSDPSRHNHWILEAGYDFRIETGETKPEGEVIDLWIYTPFDAEEVGKIPVNGVIPEDIRQALEDLAAKRP